MYPIVFGIGIKEMRARINEMKASYTAIVEI